MYVIQLDTSAHFAIEKKLYIRESLPAVLEVVLVSVGPTAAFIHSFSLNHTLFLKLF